jgi:hypothetical protein
VELAVATTSGSSATITGIPSWAKRVTVMFNGVGTNGTNSKLLQIGSGSLTTTGYFRHWNLCFRCGFHLQLLQMVMQLLTFLQNPVYGSITLSLFGSNTWVAQGVLSNPTNQLSLQVSGLVALSGALDRVAFLANGDTLNAGSINILYE